MSRVTLPDKFLICAAIGSGSSALAAQRGGADFLIAINAGRLRNMGAPSIASMLPLVSADTLLEGFAREDVLSQCQVPVLLGVNVWARKIDPDRIVQLLKNDGYAGAVNFPPLMLYPPTMQRLLCAANRGFEEEIRQLGAVQNAGLLGLYFCATQAHARMAADAGIDHICLNLGWNVGGALGHSQRVSLEEAAIVSREIRRQIRQVNPNAKLLIEGGPIVNAADLGGILKLTHIDGYVGGSTFERMPIENSVAEEIDQFRNASRQQAVQDQATQELIDWGAEFGFVGHSSAQLEFLQRLRHLATSPSAKLLLSESGSDSSAAMKALINTDHATDSAVDESSVVSFDAGEENGAGRSRVFLFGHRESTPTRMGALNDSNIRVLIIQSVEKLSLSVQQKLARAIASNTYLIPGTRRSTSIKPQLLFVSQWAFDSAVSLNSLSDAGFAPELAAQLHGFATVQPPLRERIDDLFDIINSKSTNSSGIPVNRSMFSPASRQILRAHYWPGNESEVKQVIGTLIGRKHIAPIDANEIRELLRGNKPNMNASLTDKDRIADALIRNGFSRSRTADELGISRKTLYNKMKRYGLSG